MAEFTVSGSSVSGVDGDYSYAGMYNYRSRYDNPNGFSIWFFWGGQFFTVTATANIGTRVNSDLLHNAFPNGSTDCAVPSGTWSGYAGSASVALKTGSSPQLTVSTMSWSSSAVFLITNSNANPLLPSSGITGLSVKADGVTIPIVNVTVNTTVTRRLDIALKCRLINGQMVEVTYAPGNVTDSNGVSMEPFTTRSPTGSIYNRGFSKGSAGVVPGGVQGFIMAQSWSLYDYTTSTLVADSDSPQDWQVDYVKRMVTVPQSAILGHRYRLSTRIDDTYYNPYVTPFAYGLWTIVYGFFDIVERNPATLLEFCCDGSCPEMGVSTTGQLSSGNLRQDNNAVGMSPYQPGQEVRYCPLPSDDCESCDGRSPETT